MIKTYSCTRKLGIDDLLSEYAFVGNSQGDETRTNSIEEYKNSGGWLSYAFSVELTDESIQKEVNKRKAANELYVAKLKEEGKYGEDFEWAIQVKENLLFDSSHSSPSAATPLMSHRMIFIDFDKPIDDNI